MIRPITLFPFPKEALGNLDYSRVKHVMTVEMTIPALMVDDVAGFVANRAPVSSCVRGGGYVISPSDVVQAVKNIADKGV